jgi:hypothetical protein
MNTQTCLTGSLGLTALIFVGACSGGEPAPDPADRTAAAAESADNAAPAPPDAATIRLANLWIDSGQPAPVDVIINPILGEDTPLFEGVQPGTVTAVSGLPADVWLEVYRQGGYGSEEAVGSHFLTENDMRPSDRITLVLGWTRPLGEGGSTAGIDIFFDSGEFVTGTMPARPVDGGMLVAWVSPLNRRLGENRETLTFGIPGKGCLRPAGSPPPSAGASAITTSIGGTAAITYDVPPGTHPIAAWRSDSPRCEGDPLIGPVDVTVIAGDRSYLIAWGAGVSDMRLLFLPPHGS